MHDPHFPNLPYISDVEWQRMSKDDRWQRHLLEVAEAARIFDKRQAAGMNIFDAADNLPVPRMNRHGYQPSG
jgi:hypothetical protein